MRWERVTLRHDGAGDSWWRTILYLVPERPWPPYHQRRDYTRRSDRPAPISRLLGGHPTVRILGCQWHVGTPLLEGIDYWDDMRDSPSLMEQVFAIFTNVLVLDSEGNPLNAKEAERRAAMWIRQYCTRIAPEPPLEDWEVHLYPPPPIR